MVDREKVIKALELCTSKIETRTQIPCETCSYHNRKYHGILGDGCCNVQSLQRDVLALLKAQKTSLETVAEDHGLTPDGVSFALDQYQTVISEITHGMMSKLTYNAKDVLQTAQERWCDTCELMKAQEAVEPKKVSRYIDFDGEGHPYTPETYDCGACGKELPWKANYCPECGRAVKWNDD